MEREGYTETKAKQKGLWFVLGGSGGSVGVDLALGRLGKLHVFLARHEPPQLQQHHPNIVGVLPLGQRRDRVRVDLRDGREERR